MGQVCAHWVVVLSSWQWPAHGLIVNGQLGVAGGLSAMLCCVASCTSLGEAWLGRVGAAPPSMASASSQIGGTCTVERMRVSLSLSPQPVSKAPSTWLSQPHLARAAAGVRCVAGVFTGGQHGQHVVRQAAEAHGAHVPRASTPAPKAGPASWPGQLVGRNCSWGLWPQFRGSSVVWRTRGDGGGGGMADARMPDHIDRCRTGQVPSIPR